MENLTIENIKKIFKAIKTLTVNEQACIGVPSGDGGVCTFTNKGKNMYMQKTYYFGIYRQSNPMSINLDNPLLLDWFNKYKYLINL